MISSVPSDGYREISPTLAVSYPGAREENRIKAEKYHRIFFAGYKKALRSKYRRAFEVVCPAGFEPVTFRVGV